MRSSKKKRYGIILLDRFTSYVYVLRRIHFSLWDYINNTKNTDNSQSPTSLQLSMYPGICTVFEFPKGCKQNKKETNLHCALREFQEESNMELDIDKLQILKIVHQDYTGGNHKLFSVCYYIVQTNIRFKNSTVVLPILSAPVVGDNFNILVCTKWKIIRSYFISNKFDVVVKALDDIILSESVDNIILRESVL